MSDLLPQQGMPIIIKGGSKSGMTPRPIEIRVSGAFQVSEQFQSQPSEWIQSNSDFTVSYVESIMVGELGPTLQFCQNATMAHPLTYDFKDSDGNKIFTIQEVANGGNYALQILVDSPDNYFEITEASKGSSEEWSASTFSTDGAEVYLVEVRDANNVPVCQMLRLNEADIYLNLEPAV